MSAEKLISEVEKSDGMIKINGESLVRCCQEYLRVYEIHENIEEAKNILKYYINEEDLLTFRKKKKNIKEETVERLDIFSRIYFDYTASIYQNKFKKSEKEFLNKIYNDKAEFDSEFESEIFNVYNIDENNRKLMMNSINAVIESHSRITSIKKLRIENIYKAMDIYEKEKDRLLPDPIESVNEIISKEYITLLTSMLERKSEIDFIFCVAPIRRALTQGKITSCTPKTYKENKEVFFKYKFEYNLERYNNYLLSLNDLYEEYMESKKELEEILKVCS